MTETTLTAEPGRQEVLITRTFDAPRELVFRAVTDPDLVREWWGPYGTDLTVDQLDARPGGSWRFVARSSHGEDAFHGVYHDVTAPERVVQTFEYEGVPGHVLLETATFEEVEGGTRVIIRSVYQSVEDRDGMVASGMEKGMRESHERLAELLAKMQT
jgi:uncharacterized protein YndB with AHSA1/START domain